MSPSPAWQFVPGSGLRPEPWRNGMGLTRTIVNRTGPGGGFGFQVGIADLAGDAPFSHFPDCDRVFMPLSGDPPPELSFNGGAFSPCPVLHARRFSGDWDTRARVPAPGRAFNVVFHRRLHSARLSVMRLAANDPLSLPDPVFFVLHCMSATVTFGQHAVGPGDSLVGDGPALMGTATVPGIALLAEIRSAAT